MGEPDDRQRVAELLGARDLIHECEEMLSGRREHFTGMEEYLRQRLEYWRSRHAALDRRRGERRLRPEGGELGRRSGLDRRQG